MARPRLDQQSRNFSVRMTAPEIERLDALAKELGLKRTALIKRLVKRCIGYLDTDKETVAAMTELSRQMAAVGNNINQIALSSRRGSVIWNDADRADVLALGNQFETAVLVLNDFVKSARKKREPNSAMLKLLIDSGVAEAITASAGDRK